MSHRDRRGRPRYRIQYAEQARTHLRALTARDRATVIDRVEVQLGFEPKRETRNRKPIEENPLGADFELRIGDLRVYYEVQKRPELIVSVLAVGVKERDRVRFGDEEVEL